MEPAWSMTYAVRLIRTRPHKLAAILWVVAVVLLLSAFFAYLMERREKQKAITERQKVIVDQQKAIMH
jgi:hypothetical protein